MDKNAIKKYAVWARNELIERVSQKADQYEISADADPNADAAHGVLLTPSEKKQRVSLITKVKDKGMDQVIEEVAYTWFNRFAALRFMEVNNYLPSKVRVFTDNEGAFKPEILAEAIHLEMEGLDMEKVYALKDANDDDALFKYLIITQCNALSGVLPGMFQKIADYTELLFPDNLLRDGSAIEQMVAQIPEEDWKDQVQIIGWLYQYYNTEPKDKVFADLKKNKKITKDKIPAATQLFTPDWIVRYMVENSLGRLWIEGHPNDDLKANWKYYLEEAKQEPEVQKQLDEINKEYATLTPDQIRCIDPCMGSGHIICYMFDVLMQIYEAYGYTTRDAVSSIVQNNLYGLDIDERASQLAYFAVMMKACQYDRRFLSRGIQPHVYAIMESNGFDPNMIDTFTDDRKELKAAMNSLISDMYDAKEYGSILNVNPVDFPSLYARFDEIRNENPNMYTYQILDEFLPFVQVAEAMAQKYHVVVTNPPYMGARSMSDSTAAFVKTHYPDAKADLFSCFISRGFDMSIPKGFVSMITMESWMFLSSFEKLRKAIVSTKNIRNMVHMPYLGKGGTSLGINFGTAAVIFENRKIHHYKAQYDYIAYYETDVQGVPFQFPVLNDRYKTASLDSFALIPGAPIAYWVSNNFAKAFQSGISVDKIGDFTGAQHKTANNDKYLRIHWEVNSDDIGSRWIFYAKGGDFRKWYGNVDLVVDWSEEAQAFYIKNSTSNMIKQKYWFKEGITYTSLTSAAANGFRYLPPYGVFDIKGPSIVNLRELEYCLGFFNTKIAQAYFRLLNPTITLQVKDVKNTPILIDTSIHDTVVELVKECIQAARDDWNEVETSWDFVRHPLIRGFTTIKDAYKKWSDERNQRFNLVKRNEERINELFIGVYGLQDEMTPEIAEDEITLHRPDITADIKGLISYAVGCMFGRFSVDTEGIAFGGGYWDQSRYHTFTPDKDGILPICDDEYFDDDIVNMFFLFVETIYGRASLEENLRFVADALGGKGSPREVIRNYFINDFFIDHCAMYSVTGSGKRPIYWLFDSGKKNGFKCLVYMHRYQPDTLARIRTDYVHEQQARYRTAISGLERQINGAPTSERVRLNKQLTKLKDQAEEVRVYEEKIHHLADQMIPIDLDDGVKHNYAIFQDVLAKIK